MTDLLLSPTPSITIEDAQGNKTEYKFGRLSTNAVFNFIEILKKVGLSHAIASISNIYKDLQNPAIAAGVDEQAALLLAARISELLVDLTDAEDEIAKFGAGVLGMTPEEFKEMPITFTVLFLQRLFNHPDIQVFTKMVSAMVAKTPAAKAN